MNHESNCAPDEAHKFNAWIAILTGLLFIVSLWGAWNASRQTQLPPIHDVLSYILKAQNVWTEIHRGNFSGLLGVEQTIRPFGTSLLGYPLGYNQDFRAYYWRTLAFPACFCVIGALFSALAAGASWQSPSAWLIACLGGMLPMWWGFDSGARADHFFQPVSYWGMMDGMLAGTAALATGLLIYGWRRNSLFAIFVSFFISAFTLLLKPVGVFLIAGHAFAGAVFLIWSYFKETSRNIGKIFWGWALGIGWCALICGWCYFSPYFSASNQEMGRQALEQLRGISLHGILKQILGCVAPALCIYALGIFTLGLCISTGFRFRKISQDLPWARVLLLIAGMVFLAQIALLYTATGFQISRYFLPSLAVLFIFLSPLLWQLLRGSDLARVAILANAIILAASVWSPMLAKTIHHISGYHTFLNEKAIDTASFAQSIVEKSPKLFREPVTYILGRNFTSLLIARQIAGFAGWKEEIFWNYSPRVWEKHTPAIHPHEIACADFLLIDPHLTQDQNKAKLFQPTKVALELYKSPECLSLAPVLAENSEVSVHCVLDAPGLEKTLAAHLQKKGFLHPAETGAVLETETGIPPLATFESGDDILSANAEWIGDKLRVMVIWSGSRGLKRHLQSNVALVDSRGIPIHWIPLSLVAPPTSADGLKYQRTIVDDLDCGPFAKKTAKVALGIYDLSNKKLVRLLNSSVPKDEDRILLPIRGIFENPGIQSP